MRILFAFFVLLFPLHALAGLKVVATVPDLAAIAKEVGGDKVTVSVMALPTQDPHFVDARPNLALDLSRADMLVLVGLDLEIGWLPTLLTGARNPKVQVGGTGYVDASQFATLLEVPTQKIDRAMGDIHPGGNPHYLLDPKNAVRVATGLGDRMAALDPANAAAYKANAAAFATAVDKARAGWESSLGKLRGKDILTYHKSMVYLATWLGFSVPATIEPKPGIPPAPAHVVSVLQTVQQRSIKTILQEEYYPATTAELVASKTGAKLVRLAGGADFAKGQTYKARMDALVKAIAEAS